MAETKPIDIDALRELVIEEAKHSDIRVPLRTVVENGFDRRSADRKELRDRFKKFGQGLAEFALSNGGLPNSESIDEARRRVQSHITRSIEEGRPTPYSDLLSKFALDGAQTVVDEVDRLADVIEQNGYHPGRYATATVARIVVADQLSRNPDALDT